MSFNILIDVTAFVFIHSVKINTFELKLLIFVYELLEVPQTFYTLDIVLCVTRRVHSCVLLQLDLEVCVVLLHARGCP